MGRTHKTLALLSYCFEARKKNKQIVFGSLFSWAFKPKTLLKRVLTLYWTITQPNFLYQRYAYRLLWSESTSVFFLSLNQPHWADTVIELRCPSVCVSVFLCVCLIGCSFFQGLSLALRSQCISLCLWMAGYPVPGTDIWEALTLLMCADCSTFFCLFRQFLSLFGHFFHLQSLLCILCQWRGCMP